VRIIQDTETSKDLAKVIEEATSPSLLLKVAEPDKWGPLLAALSSGEWNVVATSSEKIYRVLAYEGGLDIISHDALHGNEPVRIFPGSVMHDFSKLSLVDIQSAVAELDEAFISQVIRPRIGYFGRLRRDLSGTLVASGYENPVSKVDPKARYDLLVCEEELFEHLKDSDRQPVIVVVNDENASQASHAHKLKRGDLENKPVVLSTMRTAFARHYKKEMDKKTKLPRSVLLAPIHDDQHLSTWLGFHHSVTILDSEKLQMAQSLLSKKPKKTEDEQILAQLIPKATEAVIGQLTHEYLLFTESLKKSGRLNGKIYAATPYSTNLEKMASLLFTLSGGDAFIPLGRKEGNMLRNLLISPRKPRLPLRARYQEWEEEDIARVCIDAENNLLSGKDEKDPLLNKGIIDLFNIIDKARTGIPAATLAYGIRYARAQYAERNMDRLKETQQDVRVHDEDLFALIEREIRDNYAVLRKGISIFDLQNHLADTSFLETELQNLRKVVFTADYPPDYVLYKKFRPALEGDSYIKVFDFFRRLNRRHEKLGRTPGKVLPNYRVGLCNLVYFGKAKDDYNLLVEAEEFGKHEVLLDYLRKHKNEPEIIVEYFEQAVKQAARMAAQGPLSAAVSVDNLAKFWDNRFVKRIHQPLSEGMEKLFKAETPPEVYNKLFDSLRVVWNHLANTPLVKGFYSDRWPGNMGHRGELYNLGFRKCYVLPAVIEAVTVFQHTDYLPGNHEEKAKHQERFIKMFFGEFDAVAKVFNEDIVLGYDDNRLKFILDEISNDILMLDSYKFSPRAVEMPMEDPIHMSFAKSDSLSPVLLYPSKETLAQMYSILHSQCSGNPEANVILDTLRNYIRENQRTFTEIKSIISSSRDKSATICDQLIQRYDQNPGITSRIRSALGTLSSDPSSKNIEDVLRAEFDEKPVQYVDLLKNYMENLVKRDTLSEFEKGNVEAALNEKYVPAFFVSTMERGLIAAGAIFEAVISKHPRDADYVSESKRLTDLAMMSISNSIKAAEWVQGYFVGKDEKMVKAAEGIAAFDRLLYRDMASRLEQ